MNLGGFGALAALGPRRPRAALARRRGRAGRRRPLLAAALAVFLLSLTGIPVSAGFVGKFYLFRAAVDAGYVTLAVVGVLMSVVSAYYYLRVVVAMYMREPVGEDAWAPIASAPRHRPRLSAAVVLVLGVYPGPRPRLGPRRRELALALALDNLTHSLAGRRPRGGRAARPTSTRTARRLFLATGVIASNLPDLDLVYTGIAPAPLGYLLHHRGHTHTSSG